VVGLTIDEAGAVRNATIEKSHIRGSAPASAFHEAALTAARQVRYHPAREKGVPVRSWSTLTFTFEAPGS
jgi:TonB family protein